MQLGQEGKPFELGPDVTLRAPEIAIAAESVLIRDSHEEGSEVVLSADSVSVEEAQLRVDGAVEKLKVKSEQKLTYPLVGHRIDVEDQEPLGQPELDAAKVLFRLLSFFKSEGYEGLGAHAEPINRR